MFENQVPTEVLFLNKVGQINNRRRIEDPKKNFPEYFGNDIDALKNYNQKEFG